MSAKPPFPNTYHLRLVAASSAKACWVCYKPSTSVLITPDNKVRVPHTRLPSFRNRTHAGTRTHTHTSRTYMKSPSQDFFYVCPGHLKDRGFATADPAETERIKKIRDAREVEAEKKKVLEEFRDKVSKKSKKDAEKKKEGKDKDKDQDKKDDKDESKKDDDEAGKDDTKKDDAKKTEAPQDTSEEARIFNLSKAFYGQRTERVRSAEMAKRQAERVRNPSLFPSVPSNLPGAPATGP